MQGTEVSSAKRSGLGTPELSVVIPIYNECDLIEAILKDWEHTFNEMGISYEFIVVNDGSMDGTGRILDRLRKEMPQLRVLHQLNSGHGRAIRRGYEMARGRYILQFDSNGRYETNDFPRLWEERGPGRLVLAHRTHRLDSFVRRGLSGMLRGFGNYLFGVSLQDPNAPFRLFDRVIVSDFLKLLPADWESTNFCMGFFLKSDRAESVVEVKVPFRKRPRGTVRTPLTDLVFLGWHFAGELIRLRYKISRTSPQGISSNASA